MPAFDQCHEQVVRALQKDGWTLEARNGRIHLWFITSDSRIKCSHPSSYAECQQRPTPTHRHALKVEFKELHYSLSCHWPEKTSTAGPVMKT